MVVCRKEPFRNKEENISKGAIGRKKKGKNGPLKRR